MKKQPFFSSLLESLHAMVYSVSYMESAKVHPSDFTRRRKMSFVQYILFILQKTGRSLQAALNTFRQSMGAEPGDYSKQAFSKGRLRIRPEAIRQLFDFTVQEFYTHADFQTYEGFRVLAIDGTKLNLPNTAELEEAFGAQATCGASQVQALVSGLYDIQNKVMVDVCISSCFSSERTHAAEMIQRLKDRPDLKNLIVMDRGYPSAELLHLLQNEGHAYVVRCCTEFIRGMKLSGDDCVIEHRFARTKNQPLKLRVVKVFLPGGKVEILATNLLSEAFSAEKLAQIYRMRWGIETSYDNLKNKLYVEDFSGTSKTAVLQDFYATMFLWNLTGMLAFELEEDIEAQHRSEKNKNEYRLNISMVISSLKERVVELVMSENKRKAKRILRQIQKALHRSVVAVSTNRSFPRKRKHTALKFHNNTKRV